VGRREARCSACRWRFVRLLWLEVALDPLTWDVPDGCPRCGRQLAHTVYNRRGNRLDSHRPLV
jgi:hypothetical protein